MTVFMGKEEEVCSAIVQEHGQPETAKRYGTDQHACAAMAPATALYPSTALAPTCVVVGRVVV